MALDPSAREAGAMRETKRVRARESEREALTPASS
jgi:hypothetical protein